MTIFQEIPIEELKQIADENPTNLKPRLVLIGRLADSGDIDRALSLCDAGLAAHSENAALLEAKSMCLATLGHAKEAHELIQLAIRRSPSVEELNKLTEDLAPYFGDVDSDQLFDPQLTLIQIREQGAELDERFRAKLESSAELIALMSEEPIDMSSLEQNLKEHLDRFPDDLIIKSELALFYSLSGESEQAERVYLEIIDADPDCVPAYFELATLDNLETERALEYTQKGLDLYPDYEAGRLNLGAYLMGLGRFDDARHELARVPTDSPYYQSSLWNICLSFSNEGQLKKAIEVIEKITALSPDDIDAWNQLGFLCIETNDPERALKQLDEALKLDAENIQALNNRAVALGDLGREEEAICVLQYALRISPEDENLLTTLALRQSALGDHEAAIKTSQDALNLHPENARMWLNLGCYYFRQQNYDDALRCNLKALEIDPTKGRAYWNIASVCARQDDKEGCLENLEKSVEFSPEMAKQIKEDEDLKPYLDDPRFIALTNANG